MSSSKKWLYREGNWFLLNKAQCRGAMGHQWRDKLDSYIWHDCARSTVPSYHGCWRLTRRFLDLPCGVCKEACPEGIQALWMLQNDKLEGDWQ